MPKCWKLKKPDGETLCVYKLRMGGQERLAQMLKGLVSAPKVLMEASGGHVLALHCSRV